MSVNGVINAVLVQNKVYSQAQISALSLGFKVFRDSSPKCHSTH
ncbi:hypothetical protein [Thiomicrorhabdus sp. Kp2]|nr:hypothetical protein [Thiomicrorhabdus sp. Kp2]